MAAVKHIPPDKMGPLNKKVVVENGCSGEGGGTLATPPGGEEDAALWI